MEGCEHNDWQLLYSQPDAVDRDILKLTCTGCDAIMVMSGAQDYLNREADSGRAYILDLTRRGTWRYRLRNIIHPLQRYAYRLKEWARCKCQK